MSEFSTLLYEREGRVATITLNRPERLNAINDHMPGEIAAAVKRAEADPAVHVIVLKGAGKGFCGGYDLVDYAQAEGEVAGVRTLASSLADARGTVSVTAPPTFLSDVITPALCRFPDAHPEIELRLIGETREANLSRGEADIAFRMIPIDGAELVTRTVCEVRYDFFGKPSWLETPAPERRFIGFSRTFQPFLHEAVEQHAGRRRILSHTNEPRVALTFASAGVGIALLPRFLAAAEPLPADAPEDATLRLPPVSYDAVLIAEGGEALRELAGRLQDVGGSMASFFGSLAMWLVTPIYLAILLYSQPQQSELLRREITFHRTDGPHTYDVTATPRYDDTGALVGLVTASLDGVFGLALGLLVIPLATRVVAPAARALTPPSRRSTP